ncbi:1,25-dihydroxyvitamin D(3) 24-hydroxylase, mitochondrial-like [Anneissia japonica]|uniref:1,25-dihydroxyvitamin D(3) 24-hydroxylase, mitochondrial-like n=1 Tax=Anneissia japonica TaxID=1529436 RepID=UPI0014258A2B|nr:1,25-dihydroxyvitamin D(3) 24-hydroxylase, mitochondrial-like [Anneissia japonica]
MASLCRLTSFPSSFWKFVPITSSSRCASGVTGAQSTQTYTKNPERLKSIDTLPGPGIIHWLPKPLNRIIVMVALVMFQDMRKNHEMILQNAKKYGKILRSIGFGVDIVSLSDPQLIERFCRTEDKYPMRFPIQPWIEYRKHNKKPLGILLEEGEKWHKSRSAMSRRLLRPQEIGTFLDAMNGVAADVLERLKTLRPKEGPNKNIMPNLEEELFRWAFESACTVFFDKRLGILDKNSPKIHPEIDEFVYAFQNVLEKTVDLMFIPYKLQKMLRTKAYKTHTDSWDLLFRVSRELIDRKLNELAEKVENNDKVDDGSFLAYLVAQNKLSEEEIYGSMTELLAAAVDTTSNSVLWALYCLARNPGCQERLYEEVTHVIPEGVAPTKDHFNEMKYLRAVMQETQRLYPIISGIGRKVTEDMEIGGYKIPPGVFVVMDTYSISRSSEYFEDPYCFNPERWLSRVKGEKLNNFLMLPFGFGVRSCIGRRLAEQEMQTLLSLIIRNFRLEINKEVQPTSRLILVPDQPLELRLIDRN